MRGFGKILWLHAHGAYNIAKFRRKENSLKWAILFLLAVVFLLGDYIFFERILAYMSKLPMQVGDILVTQLLAVLFLTFFSMLVFSNILASISTMYMSSDLEYLFTSPIKDGSIFAAKFVLTLLNSSWMVALFGFPVLIAYGRSFNAEWEYYLYALASMPAYLVIPASAGIAVTILLMRYFPARRAYQILSFVGIAFLAGMVVFIRFMEPEKFFSAEFRDMTDELMVQFVERLAVPQYGFLPSTWISRGLIDAANRDYASALNYLAWIYGTAILSAALVQVVAGRIYFRGWTSGYISRGSKSGGAEPFVYRIARRAARRFFAEPAERGLFLKDVKLFWRDTSQWSQLFILSALAVVYIYNVRNLPLSTIYLKNLISTMNIGLAGVVIAAVAARFVFSTTSIEGKYFWVVRSAPMDYRKFLAVKFFLYLTPLVLIAETLVIVSNLYLDADWYVMTASAVYILLITVGLSGLGVGLGAMYPSFKFENVAEISMSVGGIMYMILSLAYVGAVVVLSARPFYVHFNLRYFHKDIGGIEVYLCYAAILALTVLITVIPFRRGVRALEQLEL